jgi:hypothetical protein
MSEAMTPLNGDKLAKLLALFTSPHDGERLAALDRASALLRKSGRTWATLLADYACYAEMTATTFKLGDEKKDLQRRLAEAERELATLRGGPKAERAKALDPQPQRSTGRLW